MRAENNKLAKHINSYFMIRISKVNSPIFDNKYIIIDDMPQDIKSKMTFINMVRAAREKAESVGGLIISFCSIVHIRRKNLRHKFNSAKHMSMKDVLTYDLDELYEQQN